MRLYVMLWNRGCVLDVLEIGLPCAGGFAAEYAVSLFVLGRWDRDDLPVPACVALARGGLTERGRRKSRYGGS